jgi:fatty acid desaturase
MRNPRDLQSLLYLVLYVALIAVQWVFGFSWVLFGVLLFITVGLEIIHHNHVHLGIWTSKPLNRATNYLISVLTAIPSAMVESGHLKNHHVHQHGPLDVTRTYRFGGDHNHFWGYVLHPFQAFAVLVPMFWQQFVEGLPKRSRFSRDLLLQLTLILATWSVLAAIDWRKFLLLVLVPQAVGWHWLLASNYFQHAHCDDQSEANYARNFTGFINWFWFNIGFHTAHHDHPAAHWSTLRRLHTSDYQHVDPRLNHKSFVVYFAKTLILSPLVPGLRSESLRTPEE